jgi:transcriptional regulator with XRE-family HTH domain
MGEEQARSSSAVPSSASATARERLAQWLAARMSERGFSQKQLAKYARVSQGSIRRILRGEATARGDAIVHLAEYFGDNPVQLLAEAGLSDLAGVPAEARAEAAQLLQRLYALAPHDRAAIMHQVNEILDFLGDAEASAGRLP